MKNKALNVGNALAILGAAILMAASLAGLRGLHAQDKAKEYNPSELQSLRLKVKQRDAQLLQTQLAAAQQAVSELNTRAQAAAAAFTDEVKAIAKENGWPDTVQVKMSQDKPDTIVFFDAPAPPSPIPSPSAAPAPEKKP